MELLHVSHLLKYSFAPFFYNEHLVNMYFITTGMCLEFDLVRLNMFVYGSVCYCVFEYFAPLSAAGCICYIILGLINTFVVAPYCIENKCSLVWLLKSLIQTHTCHFITLPFPFRVQNMVSSSMRAKLAAYSLALLLHMGHMTADLTLLHRDLAITEARYKKKSAFVYRN